LVYLMDVLPLLPLPLLPPKEREKKNLPGIE